MFPEETEDKLADTVPSNKEIEKALILDEINSSEHNEISEEKYTEDESMKSENIFISNNDLLQSITVLSAKMDSLNRIFTEKIRYVEYEDKIVDQMHKELQKYKEDMYAQLLRPVLLDIIEVRDSILRIADAYLRKPEGEQDIPNEVFAGYAFDVQDILEKNSVEIYRSSPGDNFVPVKQRVIKKVVTDDKELHGKVVESLSCGYNYNGRTISAEKISVYFYNAPVEIITKDSEEKVQNG